MKKKYVNLIALFAMVGVIVIILLLTQNRQLPIEQPLTIYSFNVMWAKSYGGFMGMCQTLNGQVQYSAYCSQQNQICHIMAVDKITGAQMGEVGQTTCDGRVRYLAPYFNPSHLYTFRLVCDNVYKEADLGQNCIAQ
jgi:hypothetical protein